MGTLAVQYLEDGPGVAEIAPEDARARLRAAFERLPISDVLLGWNLPDALVSACSEEAFRAGARLFRWHPLLTGDGTFVPRPEWQTIGLDGERVKGYRGLPEFTFVCPNRPPARNAILDRVRKVCQSGRYQGLFLDRIRYPSPAQDPARLLACFCDGCRRMAAMEGFDLEAARQRIEAVAVAPERARRFLRVLLDPDLYALSDPDLAALRGFLCFRAHSVTRFVWDVANVARAEGLAVDLDCFSPAVAWMVGQDLGALSRHCERIKIMSYGHALGPAGLPFELLALADWLIDRGMAGETEALEWLSQASHLALPSTRAALHEYGLSSEALAAEVRRARSAGIRTLLAGIELVELEGVTTLHTSQIEADLRAFRAAGADGLVLSWDLWHIPLERLGIVRDTWLIEIQEASVEDKPILRNLLELCHHDCSQFNGDDVDEHGLYGYKYLDHYWTEPGRHPFVVRVGGKLAGFALVRTIPPGEGRVDHSMAEFFILRKYRRQGIGQIVVHRIFDRFPGRWRVAQERDNLPAQAFWRKVISRHTNGHFVKVQEEDWDGPIYEFGTPVERWHRGHRVT